MKNFNVKTTIITYASIAFILIGVLFGMNIVTLIFGQTGGASAGNNIPDLSTIVVNESGWINTSGYTVATSNTQGFGNLAVVLVNNQTNQVIITSTNFSSSGATITGNGKQNWTSANITYTYTYFGNAELNALNVQNNSLLSVNSYAAGAPSQMSTISIVIIIALLVSLFALFMVIFAGKKGSSGGRAYSGGSSRNTSYGEFSRGDFQ